MSLVQRLRSNGKTSGGASVSRHCTKDVVLEMQRDVVMAQKVAFNAVCPGTKACAVEEAFK